MQFLGLFMLSSWPSSHSSRLLSSWLAELVAAEGTRDWDVSFSPLASDGSFSVETSSFEFSSLHDWEDVLPREDTANVGCPVSATGATPAARSVSAAEDLFVSVESSREFFPAVWEGHGEEEGSDGMYLLSGPRIWLIFETNIGGAAPVAFVGPAGRSSSSSSSSSSSFVPFDCFRSRRHRDDVPPR